jgi:tetratricopeptide (TPR) repeat protein
MRETQEPAVLPAAKRRRRRALLAAVMVFATAGAAAYAVHARKARRIEAVATPAKEAVRQGPVDEARPLVEKWRAIAPESGEPDYYLAWLDIRAGRPAQAMDSLRAAASKGYALEPLEILRAILMAQAGQFEEAVPILLNGFESDSGPLAEIADALVRFYMRTVRLGEADAVISRWMAAAPQDARPYVWRADIYNRGGREVDLVIRDDREALRRDPTLLDTRLDLAEKLLRASQIDEAAEEYTKVLAHRPKSVPARVGLGRIALLKGDIQGASRHFEEAVALDPDSPRALRELALLDVKFGRLKQARERLEKAVRLDPEDLETRYSYARVLAASGDAKAAAEQTQRAERLRSDQKQIEDLRKQLAGEPDNLEIRSEVARWLIEHGHDEEGLDWTRRILAVKPDHPATCRILANYHAKRDNPGLANYYRMILNEPDRKPVK